MELQAAGEDPSNDELVTRAAERVGAHKSDVSAATLKMQVVFDSKFHEHGRSLATLHARRARRLDDLWATIRAAGESAATDYDAMQSLHRAILTYVGIAGRVSDPEGPSWSAPGEGGVDSEEAKEVASAMESVFPRSALKGFVSQGGSERQAQLEELVRLTLGIRLFNWRQGRGSSRVPDVFATAVEEAQRTMAEATRVLEGSNSVSEGYVGVLAGRLPVFRAALEASGVDCSVEASTAAELLERLPPAASQLTRRWIRELINRRQLASVAQGVLEDLRESAQQLEELAADAAEAEESLVTMVSGKASVAKSEVYPRFYQLADAWLNASQEAESVRLRAKSLDSIRSLFSPSLCTLSLEARKVAARVRAGLAPAVPGMGMAAEGESAVGVGAVERLHLETSPDAMSLPLDFHGYCPVMLAGLRPAEVEVEGVTRDDLPVAAPAGVLVTGDPKLGVLRWRGQQVICSSEEAVGVFTKHPAKVYEAAQHSAAALPELVRLLQLDAVFPEMDLAAMLEVFVGAVPSVPGFEGSSPMDPTRLLAASSVRPTETGTDAAVASLSVGGRKKDAGTDTPVHFVTDNVIPSYTFSEWELRRRALRAASLHHCKTSSTQTDRSHFRKDADTQVNPGRAASTQTGVEAGTNPIHRKTFVVGMRGGGVPVPPRPSDAPEIAAAKVQRSKEVTRTKVSTVTLEYTP
jgi:hypothetical protein